MSYTWYFSLVIWQNTTSLLPILICNNTSRIKMVYWGALCKNFSKLINMSVTIFFSPKLNSSILFANEEEVVQFLFKRDYFSRDLPNR